ncbi:OPT-domain-containing protein [Lepidopterella palustris CBS 459.81]|uniref:OPT-domain-containing protein n=1 Tax=Lepidopterella palustris CBS 459.81 TaxID=1314670 RepID=A0A8E2JII4_9PEZI|nr:OPT-domain-containing protein [Lepidopterella palustris CBS 459.81]
MKPDASKSDIQSELIPLAGEPRVRNTKIPILPSSGTFELHELQERANQENPASCSCAEPDEYLGQLEANSISQPSSAREKAKMSRTPLLFRSSPAQGTGSYGALPVVSLSSSAGNSDVEDYPTTRIAYTRTQRKGKGKLRHSEPSAGRSSLILNSGHVDLARGDASFTPLRTRQRSFKVHDGISSSRERHLALDEALEGQQESGLEPRFTSGSVGLATPGMSRIFESPQPSSSSSALDEPPSDNEDFSEEDLLHDKKPPGHPADDSPYAQVRASVSPTDDISLSINTPRMWTLSILFAILGSSTNLFFSLRYPSVSITPIIALLLVHPLGLLWDQLLREPDDPEELFVNGSLQGRNNEASNSTPQHGNLSLPENGFASTIQVNASSSPPLQVSWRRRLRLWLAQGHWNEKEHCCVYISSNVSFGFAFATDVIVEQTQFYHQNLGVSYQILLTLSTQILGYALAGLTRRYLVHPSGMIWPGTLMSASMFSTLHKEEEKPANGWRTTRSKFFLAVFGGSVAFYLLPGLLMPALSYFNVITWFAPENVVVANLFGISSGLGLFPLTFDWSQIAYIGSPLITPFWAALNIVGGLVIVMWIMAPIMYYTNVMFSSYLPILSSAVFDNTGQPYDVSRILTPDFLFDKEAYQNYSRVFLPITYVLSYALQFAALAALISHTSLWHGKDIWRQWRRSLAEIRDKSENDYEPLPSNGHATNGGRPKPSYFQAQGPSEPGLENLLSSEDVHNRLMRRYEDVPIFWYLLTGISMTAIGIFVVEYFPIHLPWYGLLLALGIGAALFIPIGIVMAITNQQSSLYLICQLICGVTFPGRPVANMVFTTYGYITSTQGLKFSSDLKLGHYMKIPPRILFTLQLTATVISSLTQIGVLNWMLGFIPGICTPEAINGFTCPIARVHFNGSILWGVVGPRRFFGPGALYRPLIWAFLIGALSPVGVWLLGRRNRNSIWRKVNLPVLFGSLSWIPPATGLNFSVWAIVCWIFNYEVHNRRNAWWRKYNMTLSAALDSGLAVGVVVVFFGVVYPGWMSGFKWWGTEVYKQGCDWKACPYKEVPAGQHFGPDIW